MGRSRRMEHSQRTQKRTTNFALHKCGKMPSLRHDSTVSSYMARAGGYRTADRCKADAMNVLHHYQGLKPKLGKYTFNDGRVQDLLCLSGTIPVLYRGWMYNVPVAMWILKTHPVHAPHCYVTPTCNMKIKVSSNVDRTGKMCLPYLNDWDQKSSDILGVIRKCIMAFRLQLPVFTWKEQIPAYPPAYSASGQQNRAVHPPAQSATNSALQKCGKMLSLSHDSTVSSYLARARYRTADRCKSDIMNVLHHYQGLKPKLDKFTFNDGRVQDLLCLSGTIPVPYRGSMYNIPVAMWIPDTHPVHAPLCYVTPTCDMEICVSSNVDGTGKIYLPYLHEWDQKSSDILSVIQMCIIAFGEQSPVFARSQQPPAYTASGQQNQAVYPPGQGFAGVGPSQQSTPYPPATVSNFPGSYGSTPYPPANSKAVGQSGTKTAEHYLMSLRSPVEDKIRCKFREEFALKNVKVQSLKKKRDELRARQESIRTALAKIDRQCVNLKDSVRALQAEEKAMDTALDRAKEARDGDDSKPEDAYTEEAAIHEQAAGCRPNWARRLSKK